MDILLIFFLISAGIVSGMCMMLLHLVASCVVTTNDNFCTKKSKFFLKKYLYHSHIFLHSHMCFITYQRLQLFKPLERRFFYIKKCTEFSIKIKFSTGVSFADVFSTKRVTNGKKSDRKRYGSFLVR